MDKTTMRISNSTLTSLCDEFKKNNRIEPEKFEKYEVKRGLRNADGSGVMAGLTRICNVHGYVMNEGEKAPVEGRLIYRGIDINDLVGGCVSENRFGFEETAWLLLFGIFGIALLRCAMIAFVEVSSFGIGTSTMYLATVHPLLVLYAFAGLLLYGRPRKTDKRRENA